MLGEGAGGRSWGAIRKKRYRSRENLLQNARCRHSRGSCRENSFWEMRAFWISAYAGMKAQLGKGSLCMRLESKNHE